MDNNLTDLFNELFGSEEEQEEASQYNFSSEGEIDDAIESVKELDEDEKRFKAMHKEKLDKLNYELQCKLTRIEKKREWLLTNLKESVMKSLDKKDLKSMYKKVYLSGEVQIKKSVTKLLAPVLTEKEITEKFSDYKKSKTEITLDWKGLKANLQILNNKIIDVSSGEDLTGTILTEKTLETVTVK